MNFFKKWLEFASDWIAQLGDKVRAIGVVASLALLTALICQSPFRSSIPHYRTGEISTGDIKAKRSLKVADEELTNQKRKLLADQVLDVYDYDPKTRQGFAQRIEASFKILVTRNPSRIDKLRPSFEAALGVTLDEDEWKFIRTHHSDEVKKSIIKIESKLDEYWVLNDNVRPQGAAITLRDISNGKESEVPRDDFQRKMITLPEIKVLFQNEEKYSKNYLGNLPAQNWSILTKLTLKLTDSDVVFNKVETKARQEEARSRAEAGFAEIVEGEMIVREGQRITREQELLLTELNKIASTQVNLKAFFEFALLIGILISLFYQIGARNFRKFKLSFKDQLVTGGFFVGSLAFIAILHTLFDAAKLHSMTGASLNALLPLAFAGMTLRLFTSMEITTFFVMLFSVCVAWMFKDPYFALVNLGASMTGAAGMRHIGQRLDVFRAGMIASVVQALLIILGVGLELTPSPGFSHFITNIGAIIGLSLGAGLLCSSLVLGVQPLLEYLGYTTDLRLMELASTNHPLLKDLILNAPGTYFHSFTVSQLAEKAAEAIHANSLFARVASLYHDIGKVKKPQYFIENIQGENMHDKLVPTMSALIISNHVKDGIDLGYQYRLPQSIIEIIPQHHGTSLISYFYDKAKKQGRELDDRDFRYPGPKPQTREGAIILLADAVEATAKSLANKTPEQFRQIVHATIQRFFLDGQLDECELSLKDLNAIQNAFLSVLQGVYHQRIDYPHLQTQKSDPEFEAPVITKVKP
ncbi:MAG: HDIG domain-containing protein [Deltaproteobacteria bacterium]|nr:HDIG domain-containing protein [Deltaproteobacteria bacterium]